MIHWLVQTTAAHPDLIRGQAAPGLLSAAEADHFAGFSFLKRRQDWLLGRWTSKLLLQGLMRQESGRTVPLNSISILPGKDGAPRVSIAADGPDPAPSFSLSISHSHGTSLCAAVTRAEWPLGTDIELIEARSPNFAADFFTEEEQAQVSGLDPEMQEMLVTAVWSGKEAALKAIHEGLRSDTRSVSCHFEVGGNEAGATSWHPFHIRWQREADRRRHPALSGYWMVNGQYVHTLASAQTASNEQREEGLMGRG